MQFSTVVNLRLRYLIGLSAIALLVTASYITLQQVVSEQRDFSKLVNLASHQPGLTNRIAYFASLMASTADETEFSMARSQVGRTINKIKTAHADLRNGNPEKNIRKVTNDNLHTIYNDPMVGLDNALKRFLERAQGVYDTDMEVLTVDSVEYIFLTTYGPHVLEPLFDAAVEEYERIGHAAILKIEKFELIVWLTALATLFFELLFIFRPFEKQIKTTLSSLENSVSQLTNTKTRLLAAQKMASVGDWELDLKTKHLSWSDQVYAICGVFKDEFPVTRKSSLSVIHPDDHKRLVTGVEMILKSGDPVNMELRVVRPDGQERLVFQHIAVLDSADGRFEKLAGTIQDITEQKELSIRLKKLALHIPGFMFQFCVAPEGKTEFPYVSSGINNTCGIQPEAVQKNPNIFFELFHEDDRTMIIDRIKEAGKALITWGDQFQIRHPLKGTRWLEGHASPERLADGSVLWYGYIWDITERKRAERKIKKMALYDSLTGLANRRLIKDRLSHAIAISRRNRSYGAVLMLDLDNFKNLNDTKGHNVGDALLIEVALRMQSCSRETDTVGRLGGDEFVMVLEGLGPDEQAASQQTMKIAEKLRHSLGQAYILAKEEHLHHTSASIGMTLFKDKDSNESDVLKRADVAMYEAKDMGRNRCCFYNERRQALVNSQTELAHALQQALENDEFSLHFQPQFLNDGSICSAEALLRWYPPGKDPISPGSFIPVAENTGLIVPLGDWVLKRACQHLVDLSTSYYLPSNFSIAVNISAKQLSEEGFVNKVAAIFSETGVDSSHLTFELTESCLVQDIRRAKVILNQFREMGLKIELDDFGTGYSSLNSINDFPLTGLKLDRSLINDIEKKESRKAVVRAALAISKAMSITTIAEGVETEGQIEFLKDEGCEMFQGFYYAKPMPFDDFVAYLYENDFFKNLPEKMA